jgi:hypothetical protein
MVPALVGVLVTLVLPAVTALTVDRLQNPGDVVQPRIVIPGEWMTDQADHFLFLPLTVPANVAMPQCKVMSNGESLLIVVTERPQEEPETNALRKYKLVVEAIKKEAVHDEALLQAKLQTWLDTEDDDEVKVHIQAALDSMNKVQKAKRTASPKTISVSLGLPHGGAAASSLLELPSAPNASTPVVAAPAAPVHALPALLRGATTQKHHHHSSTARIIKESFAVEIPYPVPTERIVILKTNPTTLMVAMPLVRKSLEASGISTGGKPFNRVPVFNNLGAWVAGPKAVLGDIASDLNVASVVSKVGMKPLSD